MNKYKSPRTGVWIETYMLNTNTVTPYSLRTGVWIETVMAFEKMPVIPDSPRTGVWIETNNQ